jgi:hypothetical protein
MSMGGIGGRSIIAAARSFRSSVSSSVHGSAGRPGGGLPRGEGDTGSSVGVLGPRAVEGEREKFMSALASVVAPQVSRPIFEDVLRKALVSKHEDRNHKHGNLYANPLCVGWLYKQGGNIKTWKRRWCVLTAACMFYFKDEHSTDPIGFFQLENVQVHTE